MSRMKPWLAEDGSAFFGGWARMAQPLTAFNVVEVAKPKIGENAPARVRADVTINVNLRPEVRREWENLRKHDVCLLLTVRPTNSIGAKYSFKEPFVPQVRDVTGMDHVMFCKHRNQRHVLFDLWCVVGWTDLRARL